MENETNLNEEVRDDLEVVDEEKEEDNSLEFDESEVDEKEAERTAMELEQREAKAVANIRARQRSRGYESASIEEKREIYSEGRIIPLEGYEDFETDADIRWKEYTDLIGAEKSKRILTGKVVRIAEEEGSDGTVRRYVCVPYGENFEIKIPITQFDTRYARNPELAKNDGRVRARLNLRIDSIVDFTITKVFETGYALGNRVDAMNRKAFTYFLPHGNRKPIISEGVIVPARICYKTMTQVCVEVCGMEKVLKQEDVTYKRIADVREELKGKKEVLVKITTLNVEDKGDKKYSITFKCSIKEASPNPMKKHFDKLEIGSRFAGSVAAVNESGIFVNIETYDVTVLCGASREFPNPGVGERVFFEIDGRDEKEYKVHGHLIHIIN